MTSPVAVMKLTHLHHKDLLREWRSPNSCSGHPSPEPQWHRRTGPPVVTPHVGHRKSIYISKLWNTNKMKTHEHNYPKKKNFKPFKAAQKKSLEMWISAHILTLRKRPTFPSFVASNKNMFPLLNFFRESGEIFLVSLGNSFSQKTWWFWYAGDLSSWGFCIWALNSFIIFCLSNVVAWLHLPPDGVSSLHLVISITSDSISRLSSESLTW